MISCSCTAFHAFAFGLFRSTCPRCKGFPISTQPCRITMVQLIISRLARIWKFWGGTTLFLLSSCSTVACKHGDLQGYLPSLPGEIGLSSVIVRSMTPFSSDIFCLAWAQIPGILLRTPNWMGFRFSGCACACQQARGTEVITPALLKACTLWHACSAADCAYGREWRELQSAPWKWWTISYFGQEPNPLSHTFNTCPVKICIRPQDGSPTWQDSVDPASHESRWCRCTVKHYRKIKMRLACLTCASNYKCGAGENKEPAQAQHKWMKMHISRHPIRTKIRANLRAPISLRRWTTQKICSIGLIKARCRIKLAYIFLLLAHSPAS